MSKQVTAAGNIAPSRFVKMATTTDNQVLQAGAGELIAGISGPGTRNTPYSTLDDGFIAIAGENLRIYDPPDSEARLQLGGTVAAGDLLKSDANGKGVTAGTDGDIYGARAEQAGVVDQLITVEIVFGYRGA